MESKGLGDVIEKITTSTGIKAIVDKVSEVTKVPCNCDQRKEALNNPDLLVNKILFKGNVQAK